MLLRQQTEAAVLLDLNLVSLLSCWLTPRKKQELSEVVFLDWEIARDELISSLYYSWLSLNLWICAVYLDRLESLLPFLQQGEQRSLRFIVEFCLILS